MGKGSQWSHPCKALTKTWRLLFVGVTAVKAECQSLLSHKARQLCVENSMRKRMGSLSLYIKYLFGLKLSLMPLYYIKMAGAGISFLFVCFGWIRTTCNINHIFFILRAQNEVLIWHHSETIKTNPRTQNIMRRGSSH